MICSVKKIKLKSPNCLTVSELTFPRTDVHGLGLHLTPAFKHRSSDEPGLSLTL